MLFFGRLDEIRAVVLEKGFRRLLVALLERTLADEMVLSLNLRKKEGVARETKIVLSLSQSVVFGQLRGETSEELGERGGRSLQMDAESPEAAKVVISVRVLIVPWLGEHLALEAGGENSELLQTSVHDLQQLQS